MSYRNRKKVKSEDGAILIELIYILPIVILIALLVVDVTRALRVYKLCINFSREAANAIYRDCSLDDLTCISLRYEQISALLAITQPTATLIVKQYESDGTSDFTEGVPAPIIPTFIRPLPQVLSSDGNFAQIPVNLPADRQSKVSADGSLLIDINNSKGVNSTLTGGPIRPRDQGLLVTAEVYIPFAPITPVFQLPIINTIWDWNGTLFYDVTVI